jgi:hypothetical protein
VTAKGRYRYFRLCCREGGRVVTTYVGAGPEAELVADLDAAARRVRELTCRRDRDARDALLAGARAVLDADRAPAGVFAVVAYQAGFHLHRREWRRKRGPVMSSPDVSRAVVDEWLDRPRSTPGPLVPISLAGVPEADRVVLAAAARGDPAALARAEAYLSDPTFAERWGSPMHAARIWLVVQASGSDPLAAAAADRQMRNLRDELGWARAGVLDRLAITRVAHNWFATSVLEARAAQLDPTSRERAAAERSLTQAERRFQMAVRTLALLRKVPASELAAATRTAAGGADPHEVERDDRGVPLADRPRVRCGSPGRRNAGES